MAEIEGIFAKAVVPYPGTTSPHAIGPSYPRGKSNFTGLLASRRALWSRKTTKLENLFSTPEINDHELVFDGL